MTQGAQIKVLIVDDSKLVRDALKSLIATDSRLVVIGSAIDPFDAARHIKVQVPDVIVLDIEMPRMDGITFLRRIMAQRPIPVVICSAMVADGSQTLIDALNAGAVEIIQKPKIGTRQFFEDAAVQINDQIVAAAGAKLLANTEDDSPAPAAVRQSPLRYGEGYGLIAIGASTGGTEALRKLLCQLPADGPPIVVVQHMPEQFTRAFATHLDKISHVSIREAVHGQRLMRGTVTVAPGNQHMKIVPESDGGMRVQTMDGALVNRHRPSVDVMFHSVARFASGSTLAIILTGMGDDGAEGLKAIRNAGGVTLGQDEESCVVYGMSRAASRLGAVGREANLTDITQMVVRGRGPEDDAAPEPSSLRRAAS
ncbi:MAG: chemotaxis response regulator protein-glutamate methylesterase [Pseudomonadota bacterium]